MQSEQNLEEESSSPNTGGSSRGIWWRQAETTESTESIESTSKPRAARWWRQGESASTAELHEEVRPVAPTPSPVAQAIRPATTAPITVAVAPPVHIAPLDIGEELEAEALRRSRAETRGERVAIYANNQQNIARLQKRMRWTLIPIVLYGILALFEPSLFFAIWLFLIVECIGLYQWSKRIYARQTMPVVTLTDAGIEIHSVGHDMGLVRWSEIGDIRAYNFVYRYVGITPRDSSALCARLNRKQRALIKANLMCIPVYRLFRQFVAPINLAQQNLPLSADALVAKIEAFRATHRV